MQNLVEIESSKSIYNRALIIQFFNPLIKVIGQSQALDVKHLKQSLSDFHNGKKVFNVGEAGTGLRFFSFLLSRFPGVYQITGASSLFLRPQEGLNHLLTQLGCTTQWSEASLTLHATGWNYSQPLDLPFTESSQFISGLILSSWKLDRDLEIHFDKKNLGSLSYLILTLDLMSQFGFKYEWISNGLKIFKFQNPEPLHLTIEPDASSVAALLMAASLKGSIKIRNVHTWLQPDAIIFDLLSKIGADLSLTKEHIEICSSKKLTSLDLNLDQTPDLVPCLAALLCFSVGQSTLSGLGRLKFKESDRLANTADLLRQSGILVQQTPDQLIIQGRGLNYKPPNFTFDPHNDHRMAMAAALFKLKNNQINILTPECVNKSFPQFWSLINQL